MKGRESTHVQIYSFNFHNSQGWDRLKPEAHNSQDLACGYQWPKQSALFGLVLFLLLSQVR